MKATSRSATAGICAHGHCRGRQGLRFHRWRDRKSMSGLNLPLPAVSRLQSDYLKQATELWNQNLRETNAEGGPPHPPTSASPARTG